MPTNFVFQIASIFVLLTAFAPHARAVTPEEVCSESTRDEVECFSRIADRAETQLEKDFLFLSTLARTRNPKSAVYFKLGHDAFKSFVQRNCESERHDAFGGSLEEVLEQKCRRDTFLARRRLFEKIGEPHPLGRTAESILGRPICDVFSDSTKPAEISAGNLADAESLRVELDRIGKQAAASGVYQSAVAGLLRAVHEQAERASSDDATLTCLGIFESFCSAKMARSEWLSRCQTQIHGAFYKRATVRLRTLKAE